MARVLAAVLALVGIRYAAIGVSALLSLPEVTSEWIRASGDPDFHLDYGMFMMWAGFLSVLLIALGVPSAIAGAGVVMGKPWARRPWLWLTLLALVVHTLWIFARLFPRRLTRETFVWFALVCCAYGVVWALQRPLGRARTIAG